MKKTIKLLVPIDFSNCSENALAFAMQLADNIKANLLVLNVSTVDSSTAENPFSVASQVEEKIWQSKRRIDESIKKATERVRASLNKAPTVQTDVEMGEVKAAISSVATKNQINYIVMGTQGENSTLDKYLGSAASNVLKNAPCPVIVIPENTDFEKKITIGYATDFSDADPFEIWRVLKLFKSFEPTIKCVHFNEKQTDNEDKTDELATFFAESVPEANIEFFNLPAKDKVKDMNDFVKKENINMLVMYKPKRSFFESIFHTSYTQKMARHTKIPLLVMPKV